MARETLAALIIEACETARNCNLSDKELERFACEFAGDMTAYLHRITSATLMEHNHITDKTKAANVATDVTNRILAGDPPLLCACNRSWVTSESRTQDAAGKWHGYNDCD